MAAYPPISAAYYKLFSISPSILYRSILRLPPELHHPHQEYLLLQHPEDFFWLDNSSSPKAAGKSPMGTTLHPMHIQSLQDGRQCGDSEHFFQFTKFEPK